MFNNAVNRFRLISAIEGISYLILVFIAMPLKYFAENPYAVKVVGMTHGILFIIFVISLLEAKTKEKWDLNYSFKLLVLSLIPFGAIAIENSVKKIYAK